MLFFYVPYVHCSARKSLNTLILLSVSSCDLISVLCLLCISKYFAHRDDNGVPWSLRIGAIVCHVWLGLGACGSEANGNRSEIT